MRITVECLGPGHIAPPVETTLDEFCTVNEIDLGEQIGIEAELWTNGEYLIGGGAAPLFRVVPLDEIVLE